MVSSVEIRIRGKGVIVPATNVDNRTVIVVGKLLKMASVQDEIFLDPHPVSDPEYFIQKLRAQRLPAHVFTFAQRLPEIRAKYQYPIDCDNVAAIDTRDYENWWRGLPQETRKNVRRAAKRGVVVKTVVIDDDFVRGVVDIYNESPLRQGKPFYHFGKDFETIKRELSTFPDTSQFIGAYRGQELIGFVKMIQMGPIANIMHVVSKQAHSDARPTTALIAETAAFCFRNGTSYLIYGNYTYGRKTDSSLALFKRRHGFEKIEFPRYYIPLTITGRLIVALKLHRGVIGILPQRLTAALLAVRSAVLHAFWKVRRSDARLSGGDS